MQRPPILPTWSTDANYTNGADTGLATRLEPTTGEKAEGLFRGKRAPARKLNWLWGVICDFVGFLDSKPELYEATASETIDLTTPDWSWVRWIFVEVVGGGGGGGNGNGTTTGGGGGGSGRKVSGWLYLDKDTDSTLALEVGSGGNPAGTGIGGLSRVRYGTPQCALIALGGLPGTLADGGNGYSGGGSVGGSGGSLGSNGGTADGAGGEGLRDLLGSGDGIEVAAAPGEGDLAGGGGGAAGHWPGVSAGGGGGVGGAAGGEGGTGVGAGGGGGGGGLSGDGGTGARGGIRIWKF